MSDVPEPQIVEVSASASIGGKVQIVKFEYNEDFHFSLSGKWEIPPEWNEKDAEDFRNYQVNKLREELEPIAEKVVESLVKQRDELA